MKFRVFLGLDTDELAVDLQPLVVGDEVESIKLNEQGEFLTPLMSEGMGQLVLISGCELREAEPSRGDFGEKVYVIAPPISPPRFMTLWLGRMAPQWKHEPMTEVIHPIMSQKEANSQAQLSLARALSRIARERMFDQWTLYLGDEAVLKRLDELQVDLYHRGDIKPRLAEATWELAVPEQVVRRYAPVLRQVIEEVMADAQEEIDQLKAAAQGAQAQYDSFIRQFEAGRQARQIRMHTLIQLELSYGAWSRQQG